VGAPTTTAAHLASHAAKRVRRRRRRAQSAGDRLQRTRAVGFIGPATVLLILFYVAPILVDAYYSFTNAQFGGHASIVGFGNYRSLAGDSLWWSSVLHTLELAAIIVGVGIVAALLIALLLSGTFVGKGVYRLMVYLPQSISNASGAIIWVWLFDYQHGPIDEALRAVGLNGPAWLTDPRLALLSVAVMILWQGTGFYMVILLAAIENVPRHLIEAAKVEGAGAVRVLWHIILPSIRPSLLFVVLTWSLGALQVFTQPYLATGGGPVEATYTMVYKIYIDVFQGLELGPPAAEAMFLLAVSIIVGVLALRFLRTDEAEGA
jgi:multiple sugar transport system permease protein